MKNIVKKGEGDKMPFMMGKCSCCGCIDYIEFDADRMKWLCGYCREE